MLGIFLYVCLLAIFGFFLAIVTGVVAKEEITVGSGMLMIFIAGIVSKAVGIALVLSETTGILVLLLPPVVFFGMLTLLLMKVGAVPGGKAAAVSGIFSAVYLVAMTVITLSLQVPDQGQSLRDSPTPILLGRSSGV